MSLHIFSQALSLHECQKILALISQDDCILLTQDACYSLDVFATLPCDTLYVLQSDTKARLSDIPQAITMINFEQWVALSLTHQPIITW